MLSLGIPFPHSVVCTERVRISPALSFRDRVMSEDAEGSSVVSPPLHPLLAAPFPSGQDRRFDSLFRSGRDLFDRIQVLMSEPFVYIIQIESREAVVNEGSMFVIEALSVT